MIENSPEKNTHLAFGGLIVKQLNLTTQLLACLNKEYEALKARSLEQLQKLAIEKQEYLTELEQLSQKSRELLEKSSYPASSVGVDDFVKECESHGMSGVEKRWHELGDVLQQCQRQNRINGDIIQMSRQNVRHALDIIYNSGGENSSYGPAGKYEHKHLKRTVNVV